MSVLLEVCVDSLESAITALSCRADRLELCANLAVGGGTTPSVGLIKSVLRAVPLPLMVLVRCRTGPFVYEPHEIHVMAADIRAIREISERDWFSPGRVGIVIGALTASGAVDTEKLDILLEAAGPNIPVTFHRAFDMTHSAEGALATLTTYPRITRVLTSGLSPSCIQGVDTIRRLTKLTAGRQLRIMPGSGIKSSNVIDILTSLYPLWQSQAKNIPFSRGAIGELHLSAGGFHLPAEMSFRRESLGFGLGVTCTEDHDYVEREKREWGKWNVREEELLWVRKIVDAFVQRQEGGPFDN